MIVQVDIIKGIKNSTFMHYYEISCDASEIASLPTTGVEDGSNAMTSDTADVYFFNADSGTWIKG